MDEHGIDELNRLRARAYGPSADITDDPVAQARLRELEAAARTPAEPEPQPPPVPAAPAADGGSQADAPALPPRTPVRRAASADDPPPASAAPPAGPASAAAPPAGPASSAAPPAGPASAPAPPTAQDAASTPLRRVAAALRHPGRRRLGILWAASLVLIAVIAAGLAYTIARAATPSAGHHIATVTADPEFVWPNAFGWTDKGHGFTFRGFTIMSSTGGLFGDDANGTCLVTVVTADIRQSGTAVDGPVHYGCGAGGFAAAVPLTVIETMPKELRDVVPPGSAVEFVLHGDELLVYSDAK